MFIHDEMESLRLGCFKMKLSTPMGAWIGATMGVGIFGPIRGVFDAVIYAALCTAIGASVGAVTATLFILALVAALGDIEEGNECRKSHKRGSK